MEFTSSLFLSWLTAFIPDAFEAHFLDSFDAKSKLQERVLAKYKKLPRYTSASVNDAFEITLWINDHEVLKGVFLSKKSGEKELAQQILKSGLI
jgi:dsRNA-specific ribonuclease